MATYRKRDDKWQVQVRMRGVSRSRTFSTKSAAQRWARDEERALESGQGRAGSGTLSAVVASLRATPAASGWSVSKTNFVDMAVRSLGGWSVDAFTHERVSDWFRRSNHSPLVKRQILMVVRGLLRDGSAIGGWAADASGIQSALRGQKTAGVLVDARRRDRRLRPGELDYIRTAWSSEVVPVAVIDFLIDLPIRSGELTRLRWDDIDGQTIVVRDRKHPGRKHDDRVPLLGQSADIIEAQPQNVFSAPSLNLALSI